MYESPVEATPVSYSDGRDVEQYLREVLTSAQDLSSTSTELESYVRDWPSEYHLSSKRANLLRALNLHGVHKVLELGCGCGAITRYLGERGIHVDAVEGSSARAELAARRCRDLQNVNIVRANFNDIVFPEGEYDAVLLVGVVEYAGMFWPDPSMSDEQAAVALLDNAREALAPDGFVLVAIENRTGMKYVLGSHEDHYAVRYVGIHGYPGSPGIRTYTKKEWDSIIQGAGFQSSEFLYPFPDYKVPTVLLSDQYVRTNPDAYCHLEGILSRDYVQLLEPGVPEIVFSEAANTTGNFGEFANSFCILLGDRKERLRSVVELDFAHLPNFHRKRHYCVITEKGRDEEFVKSRRIVESKAVEQESGVRQTVASEAFHQGTLLSIEWWYALQEPSRFEDHIRGYWAFLQQRKDSGKPLTIDLLPSNIIVARDGTYQPFDEEWQVDWSIDDEYVMFRALLFFCLAHKRALYGLSSRYRLTLVSDFVHYGFSLVGHDIRERVDEFATAEERFQSAIAQRREHDRTREWLNTPIVTVVEFPAYAKIYWRSDQKLYTEDRSAVVELAPDQDRQTLIFDLPAEASIMTGFRFDPCDHQRMEDVGFFRMYGIDISMGDGESREVVWKLDGGAAIANAASLSNIVYHKSTLGSVFAVIGDDPSLEFSFVPRIPPVGSQCLRVTVDIGQKRSREYVLARDHFLLTRQVNELRLRKLEQEHDRFVQLEAELDAIKRSRGWRMILAYRNVVDNRVRPRLRSIGAAGHVLYREGLFQGTRRIAKGLRRRVLVRMGKPVEPIAAPTAYESWLKAFEREPRPAVPHPAGGYSDRISVVGVCSGVDMSVVQRLRESLLAQDCPNWELCLVHDGSAVYRSGFTDVDDGKVVVGERMSWNAAAAWNDAAALATGEYLLLLNVGGELAPDAVSWITREIGSSRPDMIILDEDGIRPDGHLDLPVFKPAYSPDLLLSTDYIGGILAVKRSMFLELGGIRDGCENAALHDLALRLTEHTDNVVRLPRPVYHRRIAEPSTESGRDAREHTKRVIRDALVRRNISASVRESMAPGCFRVRRNLDGKPMISIVVPFRDMAMEIRRCVESILDVTKYPNYEVIGISNDGVSAIAYDVMRDLQRDESRVRFLEYDEKRNRSSAIHFGIQQTSSEYIVLLDGAVELISAEWIDALLEHAQRDEVAVVGGKLYYPDNTIRHAGIAMAVDGKAGLLHEHLPATDHGYQGRLRVVQNVSAVTGAMAMTTRRVWDELSGFDAARFPLHFADVDFCLRARSKGYLNVFTPYAEAYQYFDSTEDTWRTDHGSFLLAKARLRTDHAKTFRRGDPYYNPNLNQDRFNFSLRRIE